MLMRLGGLCFLLDSLVLAMFLPTGARLDEGSYKLKLTRQYYPSPRPLLCQMLALLEGIPISFTIDTLITSTSSSPRRFGTCYAMLLTTPPVLHLPRSVSVHYQSPPPLYTSVLFWIPTDSGSLLRHAIYNK